MPNCFVANYMDSFIYKGTISLWKEERLYFGDISFCGFDKGCIQAYIKCILNYNESIVSHINKNCVVAILQ